jgi:diaminopimelate epimerase
MKFTKLQSVGNDFVLIEAGKLERDWGQLSQTICRRHLGIGADGLLLSLTSEKADLAMRIFNADGSEAEACGNGIRCLVKYAAAKCLVKAGAKEIKVETIAGVRKVKLVTEAGKEVKIQVDMGAPEFDASKIPVSVEPGKGKLVDTRLIADYPLTIEGKRLSLSFVSMGNPHAIYFQKQPVSYFPMSCLGPLVEQNKLFPGRVNFEVARVISRKQIEVRVWERGVGETLGCGSGACAVAVSAQLLGYVDRKVEIKLPGGMLEVEWDRVGEVLLSGPAEIVFTGEWPE